MSSDYLSDLSVGSYGWVNDDTLAITSGAVPMASVLAPSPHDPLADFFLFDQATATFSSLSDGYFYLNPPLTPNHMELQGQLGLAPRRD